MYTTISNYAQIEYRTKSSGQQHTAVTSPCTTLFTMIDLILEIMVNKNFVEVGEEFLYTLVFHNTSQSTLTNLICLDTLNPALTYIENSLIYNGVLLDKMEFDESLELPDLPPASSGVLQFKVYAHEMPNPAIILNSYALTYDYVENPASFIYPEIQTAEIIPPVQEPANRSIQYSNIVETYLGICSLYLEQVPDKTTLAKNSIIHMEGTIHNTGTTTLVNDLVLLKFPDGTSFVPSSLYVNDIPSELSDNNTFSVGTLQPDDIIFYSYDLIAKEELTKGDFTATALAEGTNAESRSSHHDIFSNKVINVFTVQPAFEEVILHKYADCHTLSCGSVCTYSFIIHNPNDYTITNLLLKDKLPPELCYVPCSMKINNQYAKLSAFPDSIPLPDLDARKSYLITFQVMLNYIPATFSISNYFTLDYDIANPSLKHFTSQSNTLVLGIRKYNYPCNDNIPSMPCKTTSDAMFFLFLLCHLFPSR